MTTDIPTNLEPQTTSATDATTHAMWTALERKLLALGGQHVERIDDEPDLAQLIAEGRVFTESVVRAKGKPHRPHWNAARLWAEDIRRVQLATGYALTPDGAWEQHSWCIQDGNLLEPTAEHAAYFGIVLGQQAALDFCVFNFLQLRYRCADELFDDGARRYTAVINLIHDDMRREYGEHRAEIERHMKEGIPYQGRFVTIQPSKRTRE